MIRSGTNFVLQGPMLTRNSLRNRLNRGVRRWDCSCKSSCTVATRTAAHKLSSYPLAYSLVVIPLSVSRWLLFSHKNVPSAATFFGIIMFNLSGAINVLLFLIVRPQLLLFTPPEEPVKPEVELANLDHANYPDIVEYDHSPQTVEAVLMDDDV